jgi:phosphate transport system permease protein
VTLPKGIGRPTSCKRYLGWAFEFLCAASAGLGCVVLVLFLAVVLWQAWGWLSWDLFRRYESRFPDQAGIKAGLWGSFWLTVLTGLVSIPVSVAAGVYLEEYVRKGRLARFLEMNIANLAGVPSVVFGILGLTLFVRLFGLGRSVLAGALTMALLIMPTIIVATREALRAVPMSLRWAAYGLGASRWQTVRYQVLPAAAPGILTGVILALSRSLGETAPLLMVGALTYVTTCPGTIESFWDLFSWEKLAAVPLSPFTVLPIQIFHWATHPRPAYGQLAAAAVVVLLGFLLTMNTIAVWLHQRFHKRLRGR